MSYTPTEWEPTDVVTATRMNALETAVGDMNMSYTPNTWSDGDILSAEKMNALEQAVASGGGGSSDFSTAEVTVVDGGRFRGAILNNGRTESYSYNTDGVNVVVLSSGSAQIVNIDGTILSTSGQIQSLGKGAYLVTGACTITYDNSSS